jgi:CTP-dependent riboflavin kinase
MAESIIQAINVSIHDYIDISSYNSSTKLFSVLKDGYITIENSTNQNGSIRIVTPNGTLIAGEHSGRVAVYVRKGMSVFINGTVTSARYYSLD